MAVTERPPYDRTSRRTPWTDLPDGVRDVVEHHAGDRVVGVDLAGGGFTRGFAGVVHLAGGGQAFVKAACPDLHPVAAESYRSEAKVLAALPLGVPAPALRWAAETNGWTVLGIDVVDGSMPGLPWTPTTLNSAVQACEQTAIALEHPPPGLDLPRLAEELTLDQPYVHWFGRLARGQVSSDAVSPWAQRSAGELQRLVDGAVEAIDGDTACHGDLRPDNLIVDASGRTWICDWNWLSLGAAWTDLVGLLVTAHADGLDADAVWRSSWLSQGIADERVDAWLALIAAYMLATGEEPPPDFASPWLRPHQRYFATATLSWLEARRG